MPVTDYSAWDNFSDDSDGDPAPSNNGRILQQQRPQGTDQKQTATVTAGFILKTETLDTKRPAYINVCSSPSVPGTVSATPSATFGFDATLPYIVGDVREDVDEHGSCFVVECLFHVETLQAFEADKRLAESVITTALNVVSELAMPVDKSNWQLFEPAALKEPTGKYFFPPGKLRNLMANDDLTGVE